MFGRLFLASMVLALLDLYLVYCIWEAFGGLAVLGLLVLPALVGGGLARRQRRRCRERLEADLLEGRNTSQSIAEATLTTAASLLLIYPGPVSTALGFLLLVPGICRIAAAWLVKRLHRAVSGADFQSA